MALQNLQQYGCQAENNLTKKQRDLNRNSSRNKNETMFGNGHENCPEFGVLGGVIFKLDILQAGQQITVLRRIAFFFGLSILYCPFDFFLIFNFQPIYNVRL
jgi:hypothetical protein